MRAFCRDTRLARFSRSKKRKALKQTSNYEQIPKNEKRLTLTFVASLRLATTVHLGSLHSFHDLGKGCRIGDGGYKTACEVLQEIMVSGSSHAPT